MHIRLKIVSMKPKPQIVYIPLSEKLIRLSIVLFVLPII